MNLQQFLEEERNRYSKEYTNIVTEDGMIGELEVDDLLEDHDTRLINKVLDEVKREVEEVESKYAMIPKYDVLALLDQLKLK